MLARLGEDRLQLLDKRTARYLHARGDRSASSHRRGDLKHVLQCFMLVPLSPVTRTFEYFTQHLPGQIRQE